MVEVKENEGMDGKETVHIAQGNVSMCACTSAQSLALTPSVVPHGARVHPPARCACQPPLLLPT